MTTEGRLRDGGTGKEAATCRDEMRGRMAVVNVDSYSWCGGSEKNLGEVAVKTARVLNARADEVVTSSAPIRLVAYGIPEFRISGGRLEDAAGLRSGSGECRVSADD